MEQPEEVDVGHVPLSELLQSTPPSSPVKVRQGLQTILSPASDQDIPPFKLGSVIPTSVSMLHQLVTSIISPNPPQKTEQDNLLERRYVDYLAHGAPGEDVLR